MIRSASTEPCLVLSNKLHWCDWMNGAIWFKFMLKAVLIDDDHP